MRNFKSSFCLNMLTFVLAASFLQAANFIPSDEVPEEYREIGERFVQGLNERNTELTASCFNVDVLVEKSIGQLDFGDEFRTGFKTGMARGISNLGSTISSQMPEGSLSRIMRWRPFGSGYNALVRANLGDNGWSYNELMLRKDKDGKVGIHDIYVVSSGELLTQSNHRMLLFILPRQTALKQLFSGMPDANDDQDTVLKLFDAYMNKDFAAYEKLYLSASREIRSEKTFVILAYQVSEFGSALALQALKDMREYFSDEPGMAFMLIDPAIVDEDYDDALKRLAIFKKYVGVEDAAMEAMEANILILNGDLKEAVKLALKAIEIEPSLEDGYWAAISAQNAVKDFEGAVQMLKKIERKFGYELNLEYYTTVSEFVELTESEPFKEWLIQREAAEIQAE